MEDRNEFEEVKLISAFAMGVPGKRTFFLAIGEKRNWARVWLEKYLLESLGLAVDQFLTTLSKEHVRVDKEAEERPLSNDVPVGFPTAELDVDQITLGVELKSVDWDFRLNGYIPINPDGGSVNKNSNANIHISGNTIKMTTESQDEKALYGFDGEVD